MEIIEYIENSNTHIKITSDKDYLEYIIINNKWYPLIGEIDGFIFVADGNLPIWKKSGKGKAPIKTLDKLNEMHDYFKKVF